MPAPKNLIAACCLSLLLSFPDSALAQRKWKDYLITGSSMLVTGMLDGTVESISFHYDNGFKPRFPHANDQYWNPAISWENKYKNGNQALGPAFTGSTSVFAWTTDAYHCLRTTARAMDVGTLAYYINHTTTEQISKRRKRMNMLCDFAVLTVIRSIGFSLTYNVLFNTQGKALKI